MTIEKLHDFSDEQLASVNEAQYQALCNRRVSFDNLVWQTPVLSMLAQTFLVTVSLGTGVVIGKILTSLLAILISCGSVQLLWRHRYFERYHAQILEAVEAIQSAKYAPISRRPPAPGIRSHVVWTLLLGAFGIVAVINLSFIFAKGMPFLSSPN